MIHLRFQLCMLMAFSMLSGCASQANRGQPENIVYNGWQQHQQRLQHLDSWQVSGRIFIQSPKDGFSSNINWENQLENYHIRFTAPLGQGVYDLRGRPGHVTIVLPDNSIADAKDPETLIKQTLGVRLPVSGLRYWIRGLPDPADESRDILLDANERLIKLEQAGWEITINRYRQHGDYFLPDKLTMENRHMKIKMALKNWTLEKTG